MDRQKIGSLAMVAWIALAGACTPEGVELTPEQRADLEGRIAKIRDDSAPLETRRKEALLAARGRLGPRNDLGACPIQVRLPDPLDMGVFADEGKTFQLGTTPISVVHSADLTTSRGPRAYRLETALFNDVQSRLEHTSRAQNQAQIDAAFARADELASTDWTAIDGTLIIDRWTEPVATGETFESGRVYGRFYLYSYAEQAIICAANVDAENSDSLGVQVVPTADGGKTGARSDLLRDLYRRGVEDGVKDLQKVGPLVMQIGG